MVAATCWGALAGSGGCAPDRLAFGEAGAAAGDASDAGGSGGSDAATDAAPERIAPPARATAIVAGGGVSCARLDDGTIRCWGANRYGQLCIGSTDSNPHSVPIEVPALEAAVHVSLATTHGCALWPDGSASCWGMNGKSWNGPGGGKLGTGTFDDCTEPDCPGHPQPEPVVDLAPATQVATAFHHSCARTSSGDVACWGSNTWGALGLGSADADPHPAPVLTPNVGGALDIALGDLLTCVRVAQGVTCWGYDAYGQAHNPPGTLIPGLETSAQLDAVWLHACARLQSGEVACWGRNHLGQLGLGAADAAAHPTPAIVPNLPAKVVDLAAGAKHTCALLETGRVRCWGANEAGQLGRGFIDPDVHATAEDVLGIDQVSEIDSGDDHTCARRTDGSVWCWGYNEWGQLGDGTTENRGQAIEVSW